MGTLDVRLRTQKRLEEVLVIVLPRQVQQYLLHAPSPSQVLPNFAKLNDTLLIFQ